jgi:hypothetical protein
MEAAVVEVAVVNDEIDADALSAEVLCEAGVLYDKVSAAICCRREQVPSVMREVIRFLSLVANNESGVLTPSHRVDLAWHEFILCTRTYEAFCKRNFGRYIHHSPGGSREVNSRQYAQTVQQYSLCFGPIDRQFWPTRVDDDSCGACESV